MCLSGQDGIIFNHEWLRHSWLKIISSRLLRYIRDTTRQGNPYHHMYHVQSTVNISGTVRFMYVQGINLDQVRPIGLAKQNFWGLGAKLFLRVKGITGTIFLLLLCLMTLRLGPKDPILSNLMSSHFSLAILNCTKPISLWVTSSFSEPLSSKMTWPSIISRVRPHCARRPFLICKSITQCCSNQKQKPLLRVIFIATIISTVYYVLLFLKLIQMHLEFFLSLETRCLLALKCNCSNDNLFTFSCNDALSMKGLAKLQCFNGSEN